MRLLTALAAIALLAAAPATAADGDLDRRFDGVQAAPGAEQLADVKALGDVEVGWNELGTPQSLRSRTGTLTEASTAAPDDVARAFLTEQASLFGQQPDDVAALELTMNHRDARSGVTFLRYAQVDGDRAVHGASLLVVLDAQRRIQFVGGTLAPDLGSAPAPELTAAEAVAQAALAVSPNAVPAIDVLSRRDGRVTFENTLALPALEDAQPVEAELVTVPSADGGRTAWLIEAEVASNVDYDLLVDAVSGEVVYRQNQVSETEPHGLVHTGDDPDAGGQVANVLLSGIDGTWVAGATTAGNNVNAYQDLPEDDTAAAADQPNAADQHFDYTWTDPWGTTGVLPAAGAERDAVVTQLFYYTNWFHDVIYGLGFTETARNFQEDNFGRGGAGSDSVLAESDDGYGDATGTQMLCLDGMTPILCRNNANFNTNGADGNNPRMQMYVGEVDLGGGVFRRTQRANNRDTVIHEYMHGVTGRVISNQNLQGGAQSGALGEGWGDAMATSLNNDPVYGEYNNGDTVNGIRGVAYDDDNLEYGDLCSGGCQVHTDGRIWAMAMWEQRTALIAKLGPGGQGFHERLMMQGILGTPDTPSYHDARTAYLTADVNDPAPDNQCLLWRVFADNELGVTAGPDADDDTTPTVSTATPPACDPGAAIAPPAVTPEGSPVSLDGTGSTVGGDAGDTLSYAWDLDNDGQFDDSTSATPSWTFGDNGAFTVKLRVTNTAGYSDDASAVVTVTNVAPTVTIDAAQITSRVEGQALPVLAHFSDPGWLDTYTGSADPGTSHLADVPATIAITTSGPPQDVGTAAATITYGDNGSFTVEVSVTDDDSGAGAASFVVVVGNVDPTAVIDTSGATVINGVPTFMGTMGSPMSFTAGSVDPGSDDLSLRWSWDDGTADTVTESQVNPPGADPASSPTVQPRAVVNGAGHTFAGACMYTIRFRSTDDDGGSAFQDAAVLIVGTETRLRPSGWWQNQYRRNGRPSFTEAELLCFLEIAAWVSTVFDEARDASTLAAAFDVLHLQGNRGSEAEKFDRALLTALSNFAAGSLGWAELSAVLGTAEAVRLNPASTAAEIRAQTRILHDLSH